MRAGKAIGVDSIPPEACRVAGKACWCQLAEIVKQVIKCNRFPDAWKGGIMCGIPRKPRAPSTPEHSRGILISTAPCTLVGKALSKRVTQTVGATSKSWQIGCRPGFGTELPSLITMEFLAMCKQQRPAAILLAYLKGALCDALLEQVVPTLLKLIYELTFLAGRRRIAENIRHVRWITLFEQQACQKPGQICCANGSLEAGSWWRGYTTLSA